MKIKLTSYIVPTLLGILSAGAIIGTAELWTKAVMDSHNSRPDLIVRLDDMDYNFLSISAVVFNSLCFFGWLYDGDDE